MREPQIHSHITDVLADEHPLAYDHVECVVCKELVHAANNECMQTWVESGSGNYCLKCFADHGTVLEDGEALP